VAKKGRAKFCAALYQVAGQVLLSEVGAEPPAISQGEHDRLVELLLDALSQSDQWTAKMVTTKHRLAVSR
jgi:N-acetylglutamate synthase-like GNAT family acetyltransferase